MLSHEERNHLEEKAKVIRRHIIEMTWKAQSGHPGGSRSKVHAFVALLMGGEMRWDIRRPEKRFGDRFILSAGHTVPLIYATFAVLTEALDIKHCQTREERYLIPVAEGAALSGGAITEPEHGSDITRMATTAVRDGDEWVINGVKTFITNAGIAAYYVVVCQTDPEAGHRGQSMIMVEKDAKCMSSASVGHKMGSA